MFLCLSQYCHHTPESVDLAHFALLLFHLGCSLEFLGRKLGTTNLKFGDVGLRAFRKHLEEIHLIRLKLGRNETRLQLYKKTLKIWHTVHGDDVTNPCDCVGIIKRQRQRFWRRRQSEDVEAIENVIENEPHFFTKVVDNDLCALTMVTKHLMNLNEGQCGEGLVVLGGRFQENRRMSEEMWEELRRLAQWGLSLWLEGRRFWMVELVPVEVKSKEVELTLEWLRVCLPVLPVPFAEWNRPSILKEPETADVGESN
ncbi:hypothetical protein Tco_0318636 [Tanacetum coccineum]